MLIGCEWWRKKSAHKEEDKWGKRGWWCWIGGEDETFSMFRCDEWIFDTQRISVNDSFACGSSPTLLGRFVFHTPTSLLTVPPLALCLFNLSQTLYLPQLAHSRLLFLAGPQWVSCCVSARSVFVGFLVSVKSSSFAFLYKQRLSVSKASPHCRFLFYQNIQTFPIPHSLPTCLFCFSPTYPPPTNSFLR